MQTLEKIKPKNFQHSLLVTSSFGNSEVEQIVGKIISLQKSLNPEDWTAFTAAQYLAHSSPIADEKYYFGFLIHGGKAGMYELPSGLLKIEGEDENQTIIVTDDLISRIERFAPID
jgi:hypothetical protein